MSHDRVRDGKRYRPIPKEATIQCLNSWLFSVVFTHKKEKSFSEEAHFWSYNGRKKDMRPRQLIPFFSYMLHPHSSGNLVSSTIKVYRLYRLLTTSLATTLHQAIIISHWEQPPNWSPITLYSKHSGLSGPFKARHPYTPGPMLCSFLFHSE